MTEMNSRRVALSNIFPNELALKLLIVLTGIALLSILYFCIDVSEYPRHQRAQVLIILLPFAVNAFVCAVILRENRSGRLAHQFLDRSEEHTSELQSLRHLVCRLLLEK